MKEETTPTIDEVLKKHLANLGEMTIEFGGKGDCDKFEQAIRAAMQEYASLQAKACGWHWVKASERLPGKEGQYFIILSNGHKTVLYFNGKRFETHSGIKHGDIEWLDESPSCKVDELIKALDAAIAVIKQWHQADDVWDIYYNHSPEMKPIRSAKQLLNETTQQ